MSNLNNLVINTALNRQELIIEDSKVIITDLRHQRELDLALEHMTNGLRVHLPIENGLLSNEVLACLNSLKNELLDLEGITHNYSELLTFIKGTTEFSELEAYLKEQNKAISDDTLLKEYFKRVSEEDIVKAYHFSKGNSSNRSFLENYERELMLNKSLQKGVLHE